MRAALYIRVSSMGQVRDGYSLEFQEQILREFCERENYTVAELYSEGGVSGATTQRKELSRLIDDAKARRFDIVLIFRVDRFSRDPVDLLALVRTLEGSKIRLRSVTEAVDASDPAGELMLTILGAIGKFVRANIIQNAMLGKTKRAESGKYTGGKVPFGYMVCETGKYEPDQSRWCEGFTKAELVRKVFELYCEAYAKHEPGPEYICQWMNSHGVPAPDGTGQGWVKTTFQQWFKNPVYTGAFAWKKRSYPNNKQQVIINPQEEWVIVPGSHEAIVPQEIYNQVEEIRKLCRAGGRRRGHVEGGLLTGFACCSLCGSTLSFRDPKQGHFNYYTCGSKVNDSRRRRGEDCRDFPYIRCMDLEETVWGKIREVAGDPATVQELLGAMYAGVAPRLEAVEKDLAAYRKRLAEIEEEQMTLTTAFAQKRLPEHLWEKQLERLEKDRDLVDRQRRQAEADRAELRRHPSLALDPLQVIRYMQRIFSDGIMTQEEKRRALGLLIKGKGIVVAPDGQIRITLQFPMSEVACSVESVKPEVAPKLS